MTFRDTWNKGKLKDRRMNMMLSKINECVQFLKSNITELPVMGMVTGTGLGSLAESMSIHFRVPYDKIPFFPRSSVEGHEGALVVGNLGGKSIITMQGRFHIYEGYSAGEITFPIRVMARLGVKYLFISSATGGLNPHFKAGELMVITDHINLTGQNPLVGPNLDEFGPRFPDMSRVYDPDLVLFARQKAMQMGIPVREGVYAGVLGPSLETPAETRFLRMIGSDAVGMSTVSEAIVGAHCGMKILAIVVITNMNLPDCMAPSSIQEIIATAERAGAKLSMLWEAIIKGL